MKEKILGVLSLLRRHLHSNMDRFESIGNVHDNPELLHLHSNMDRFERFSFSSRIDSFETNLHSNMDRFERDGTLSNDISFTHLHSNMDRFERDLSI